MPRKRREKRVARQRSLRTQAWEKSGGFCCLCGLQMAPDDSMGLALSFTLEHIVPKSRGGTNDMENLNGSHQFCNNMKKESLEEELPDGFKRVIRWKIKNLWANSKV